MEPPNAKAAVCVPAPANCTLAVAKSPPVDHDAPLYSSVHAALGLYPPNANALACVPAPAKVYLPANKEEAADHEDPLYSSVQL